MTIALIFIIACLACLAFIVFTEIARLDRRIEYLEWFAGLGPDRDGGDNEVRLRGRIDDLDEELTNTDERVEAVERLAVQRALKIDLPKSDKPTPKRGRPRKAKA